jgi:hypothetical protein
MVSEENVTRVPELKPPATPHASVSDDLSKLEQRVLAYDSSIASDISQPSLENGIKESKQTGDCTNDLKEEENQHNDEDEAAHEGPWYMYQASDEVENIENYRPGGYHPVNIGDRLGGQYKIIHKLGHGGFELFG